MNPVYDQGGIVVHHGKAEAVLPTLPNESVDAVVTDPPYSLEFMGKEWDRHASPAAFQRWCEAWSQECLRILKPGGHLLAFGGTRTYHRLAAGVEDAGFEIRDSIHWIYGSGFPKSLDVSKAIDKAVGAQRDTVGPLQSVQDHNLPGTGARFRNPVELDSVRVMVPTATAPATDDAKRWDGWGTALKPSHEPIVVARKQLTGTVASNVLEYGTGALNIDGCRVGVRLSEDTNERGQRPRGMGEVGERRGDPRPNGPTYEAGDGGRWPANVVLGEDAAAELDQKSGIQKDGVAVQRSRSGVKPASVYGTFQTTADDQGYGGGGGASRFFPVFRYEAKADGSERPVVVNGVSHPTVKPLALMRWLVRLVTPPGGIVLDPFAGSGTTAEACLLEGFRCIAIEREADYLPLIRQRIDRHRDPAAFLESRGETEGTIFDLFHEGAV